MIVDEAKFKKCAEHIGFIPFEQSCVWRKFKDSSGVSYMYFIDQSNDPHLACWGKVFKKLYIGRVLNIVGEIKKTGLSQKQIKFFFQSIIADAQCDMIIFNSNSLYDCVYEIGLRRAGFIRPLGNRMCPLTILVDIQNERKFDRQWKRNLKKAVEEELIFEIVENPQIQDARVVSTMFEELKKMKSLNYTLNPDGVYNLLSDNKFILYYVKKDNRYLCSRIIYVECSWAFDVFASNSFESRKYSATNYLMEKIFDHLKDKGVKMFDFSRIPPSNNDTDSVYLFKNSSGGFPAQYMGEWVWCKKKILSLIFCVYNFYIKKTHQY